MSGLLAGARRRQRKPEVELTSATRAVVGGVEVLDMPADEFDCGEFDLYLAMFPEEK